MRTRAPVVLLWLALGCGEGEGGSGLGADSSSPMTAHDAGSANADGSTSTLSPYQYRQCTTFSPIVDAAVPVTQAEPMATICRAGPDARALAAPTKGPIPPEAINPGGRGYNWELLPDFIAVAGGEGVAGYIDRYELFCGCDDTHPVVDEGLQHIVGHTVPNRGFVPLAADAGR